MALHAAAAPVDDANFAKPALRGRLEIGVDELADVARREPVQVERVTDRDLDRLGERLILVFRHADWTVTSRPSSPLWRTHDAPRPARDRGRRARALVQQRCAAHS